MERNEWLLKEQARYCDKLDELQEEYNATNLLMEIVHRKIEQLQKEDELLNSQMTNLRNRIMASEKKVCQINKALRNPNDPKIVDPRDYGGDGSNV